MSLAFAWQVVLKHAQLVALYEDVDELGKGSVPRHLDGVVRVCADVEVGLDQKALERAHANRVARDRILGVEGAYLDQAHLPHD